MRTVLVSGASGVVGYGILRSLRQSGLSLRLLDLHAILRRERDPVVRRDDVTRVLRNARCKMR